MYYTLENFINFCDDMMIAEEGLFDKIKEKFTKKKSPPIVQNVKSDDPEFLESRKKTWKYIEQKSKRALNDIYKKYPKVKKTNSIMFDVDDELLEEFLTCPNVKNICVCSWSLWDYTPTARTDEDGEAEFFGSTILYDAIRILEKHLGNGFEVDASGGDWDEGPIEVIIK